MRKPRDPLGRIQKLEALMRPNKDWRQMSLDEFFAMSADRMRNRLLNKLGDNIRVFAADMDDETLVRSIIELHQQGIFGHSAEGSV